MCSLIDSIDAGGVDGILNLLFFFILWSYYHNAWPLRHRLSYRQHLYSGNAWVHHILEQDEDCYNTFRMRKDQFMRLHQLLVWTTFHK